MKRKFTLLIAALALLTMIVQPGRAWGQTKGEITWTASAQGYTNQQEITSVTFDSSVSGSFNKGTNSNPPKYYTSGTAIRCYGGNYFTISSSNTLTAITISFGNSDGSNAITTDVGTYSNGSWTGSANSVTFTIGGSSGNRRIAGFNITYSSGGTPTIATPTITPNGGNFITSQEVSISCTTEDVTIYYTLDGNDPTTTSTQYANPFTITETTTVKAFAVKDGYNDSNIATAEFTKATAMTIAEVRAQQTGDVFTTGIVTSCVGTTGYIQDATAAICVYGASLTVGNEISVSGSLQDYNGLLEITSPQVTVVSSGNVVDPEVMTVAEVVESTNQGWYIRIENATVTAISGQNTTIAQGESTIVVRGISGVTLEVNDIISLNGNIGYYNGNQIANPQDVTVQEPTEPTITLSSYAINVAADGENGSIEVTFENFTNLEPEIQFFEADGVTPASYNWMTAALDAENEHVTYQIAANDSDARTAYFKVYEANEGVYSNLVTVDQAAYVAPSYAALPFAFNGGRADIENTDGLSQEGLGSDYSGNNPKLKFDSTDDWVLLQFNERPGTLTFDIKGNSFSGGTFTIQTSVDGVTYTALQAYTELGDTQSVEFGNLAEDVRYIKWIYTNKASGNVGLGNIALAEYVEPVASITLSSYSITDVPAISATPGAAITETLTVTVANIESFDIHNLGADFCNSDGSAISGQKPDFIGFEFEENPTATNSYILTCTFEANNDPEARTAYFKVTYNEDEVVSQVVTATQLGYVAPVASITLDGYAINAPAAETEGNLAITLENIVITETGGGEFDMVFCDNQGTPLPDQSAKPEWFGFDFPYENDAWSVYYIIGENQTTEERTVYFKVYGLGDDGTTEAYSDLVTVTQAGFVVDYATLPFEWEGGPRSEFEALNGTSTYSVGDYGDNQGVYRMKLDNDDDYIQVKTNEQPGIVTVGVKMIGGASTSTITVQGSADGTTFTNVEALTISGSQNDELTLTTTNDFAATDRYVRLLFTKGSNVGVGPITIAKHVVKYVVNLNQPLNNEGTIAADKAEAAEGETVTLTATPNTGYAFDSWTVFDGELNEVTVTNNQFTMPASNVEVGATFTALQKHDIVIPAEIENNVIVDATGNQAYATETVTITVEAPANQVLATLTVTGNTSSDNITITPEVSPYVDEYTFTMPDENVTVNATFGNAPSFTVSFSVSGTIDEDLELSVTQGQSTQLPKSSTITPEGFSITGWAATDGSTEAVADPYTPTADITLFAILGQTIPHSLAINASTPNFPTSYGTANTFAEYNLAGKNFMIQQGYKNGSILQWRALGNKNGTGTMYNSEDLGKINTIILVYDSSDSNKNFTIKAGTTENPTGGTSIEPSTNGLVYTFDLSNEDYNYFVMTNGDGAGYLQSISIDYELDLNVNTVTTYTSPTASMSTDIPATTCVIVKDGAVLTFTGQNDGTADNLIIEDGGQLIVNNSVAATVEKTIQASGSWGSKDGGVEGWDLISSPIGTVNTASVTNLTPAPVGTALQYDLYSYNEATKTWYNQQGTEHPFTQLMVGEGYLYSRKENADLGFAGEVSFASITKALTYTEANGTLTGWNLVGNPYTHNITWANLEPTNVVTTGYYTLGYDGQWSVEPSTTTVIKPMQGFLVKANDSGAKIIFNNTASKSRANDDYIKFIVANSQYEDAAYAMFSENEGLDKIDHRNADIPMVYIPQNGQNYAIATMDDNTQAFELNFKAMTTGQYTLSYKAEGKYSYLHVIDRLTGEDIDMLLDGEYSFIGSPRDNEARFIVKLSYNANIDEIEVNDNFAYQNGSDIIVNGNGELQVFDVTGRMVMNTKINGIQTVNVPATGMYIFRMVGESVQTQKIVVR